jgi:hypothetical protein
MAAFLEAGGNLTSLGRTIMFKRTRKTKTAKAQTMYERDLRHRYPHLDPKVLEAWSEGR